MSTPVIIDHGSYSTKAGFSGCGTTILPILSSLSTLIFLFSLSSTHSLLLNPSSYVILIEEPEVVIPTLIGRSQRGSEHAEYYVGEEAQEKLFRRYLLYFY